jgi:hypothetical protein
MTATKKVDRKDERSARDRFRDAIGSMPHISRGRLVQWASLAVLVLILGLGVAEAMWRMKNFAEESSPSPNDDLIADIRNLPPGSVLPNGDGVYIRTGWAFLQRYQSDLVFAGHCRLLGVIWVSDTKMRIGCSVREGEPMLIKKGSHGVTIEVKIFRR